MNPDVDPYAYGEFDPESVPTTPLPPVRSDQARRDSGVTLNAVVRQCGNCLSGLDIEYRYDQVRCNNPKSTNYDGSVESTDVCDLWMPKN